MVQATVTSMLKTRSEGSNPFLMPQASVAQW